MVTPDEVTAYWLNDVGPKGWYAGGDALDADIRARFEHTWNEAVEGACGLWLTSAKGTLGYLILTDQLPRNMHRGSAKAFATDKSARAAAKAAIDRDWDMKIPEPARQFFYMPLMHSENLSDQDRCVRLMCSRMPDTGDDNLPHARAHRQIIRKFGRFPYRNDAFGRTSTAAEIAWMADEGYASEMRNLTAESVKT